MLEIDPDSPDELMLETVARHLLEGDLVAAPSDTVYGLLALPRSETAREKLTRVKGRDGPFIVLVTRWEEARSWTREVPEAVVLGSSMIEDKAIYLWLGFDGQDEPRAYTLPWSENLAKQMRKAEQEAEAEGTSVMMRRPFDGNLDEMERVFYPEPRPAPPPKCQVSSEGLSPGRLALPSRGPPAATARDGGRSP